MNIKNNYGMIGLILRLSYDYINIINLLNNYEDMKRKNNENGKKVLKKNFLIKK
jgi:hypothetical protein